MNTIKLLIISLFLYSSAFAGVDFSGDTGDKLTHADGLDTDISGVNQQISISAWVKFDIAGSFNAIVGKGTTGTGDLQYAVIYTGATDVMRFRLEGSIGTVANCIGGSNTYDDGNWHHVVAVYDNIDMRLYLDGVLDSNGADNPLTYTNGISDTGNNFTIGNQQHNGTYQDPFNGQITEVTLWDTALTADEVKLLFDAKIKRLSLQIKSDNLIGYWALDDYTDGTQITTGNWSDGIGPKGNISGTDIDGDSIAKSEEILSYP